MGIYLYGIPRIFKRRKAAVTETNEPADAPAEETTEEASEEASDETTEEGTDDTEATEDA